MGLSKLTIRLILSGAILLGLVLAFGFATMVSGGVSGIELCPQTFDVRNFSYYQIPIIGVQVTPLRRTTNTALKATNAVIAAKIPNKVPSQATFQQPNRWDLVSYRQGAAGTPVVGDAQILMKYLKSTDADSAVYWEKWTTDNPKMAAILWPEIKNFAILELYWAMPDLFTVAQAAEDETDLATELDRSVVKNCEIAASEALKLNNIQLAKDIASYGLSHGDSESLKRIQSEAVSSSKSE